MTMIRTLAFAAAAATTVAATDARASIFTFDNGGGDGSVSDLGLGTFDFAFEFTSNNDGVNNDVFTTQTALAVEAITVSGEWVYSTQDTGGSSFDTFGYFVDDVFTTLVQLSTDGLASPAIQFGTYSFMVEAGKAFGFYMFSTDGQEGAASATVYGNIDPAVIPLPAGGLLLIGALGGLALLRRRTAA